MTGIPSVLRTSVIDELAAEYLVPPLDDTVLDRAGTLLDGILGASGLPDDHWTRLRAALALVVLTTAAVVRVRQEVVERPRVFWQGNADVTREDVQVQKLVAELAATGLGARTAVVAALDDLDPDTAALAYLVARAAADQVTARLFDALGSSATQVSRQLSFYWSAARRVVADRPVPEVAAAQGARLLGVTVSTGAGS